MIINHESGFFVALVEKWYCFWKCGWEIQKNFFDEVVNLKESMDLIAVILGWVSYFHYVNEIYCVDR